MPKNNSSVEVAAEPSQQLAEAWTEHTRQRYQYDAQLSQQAIDIAEAIAAGAPASLEQFVYASLGAHPDWKKLYEQIATVNEQLQSNVPLALFSKGTMRYFGYPERFGTWSRHGNTSHDHNAFTYTFETSEQRDAKLSKLIPRLGQTANSTVSSYFSTLSLPMRTLYDMQKVDTFGSFRDVKQGDTELKNMFRSSSSATYRAPYPDAQYDFHMTTVDDEEPGEKLVVASGMHDIVKLASKSLTDVNLRHLKFAMKHEENDFEQGAD
jgi:hypothetical protein